MANNDIFILFGTKDNSIYYIANTNPIIWSPDIRNAKIFFTRYTAEYSIFRDYDNYRSISNHINNNILDNLYLIYCDKNYNEIERYKLL